jgi:hypothetical protein
MTQVQTLEIQKKANLPIPVLTLDDFNKAKTMSVQDFKSLFAKETAEELEEKKQRQDLTEASVVYMKAARGLTENINEILLENEDLQKKWSQIIKELAAGEDGASSDFERKASGLPLIGGLFKKKIKKRISTNVLEVLPEILKQQWGITEAAAKRIEAQIIMLEQAQITANEDFKNLGAKQAELREKTMHTRRQFDSQRQELTEIGARLKESAELDDLVASGQSLPDGKKHLSTEEYAAFMAKRTDIIKRDHDMEIELQTLTQQFRATKDGYAMTELQIGELNTTKKGMNAISIMLNAFLEVTRPIMMRAIVIINAQTSGLRGAGLLHALGQTMNETIKMCAFGMTVMTEQALALGRIDFLEKDTISEVRRIQSANDKVWNEFTKIQYDKVMERAVPLLEHNPLEK